MRQLVKFPDPILRQKSQPLFNINEEVRALAGEMVEFLLRDPKGEVTPTAISAVQLGVLWRVIAFRQNPTLKDPGDIQVLINPEFTRLKGSHIVREGCLSLPGRIFLVKRAKIAKIRGLTLSGETRSFRGRDFLAQVFQHEINHLDGILIDTLGKEVRP